MNEIVSGWFWQLSSSLFKMFSIQPDLLSLNREKPNFSIPIKIVLKEKKVSFEICIIQGLIGWFLCLMAYQPLYII